MTGSRDVVRASIVVDASPAITFRAFTQRLDEIKPRQHNLLSVPIARTELEPVVGGEVRDIGIDGSTCTWARVLVFEPPTRLVLGWHISPQWRVDPAPERASEVELTFEAVGAGRTSVQLVHRSLSRHGEGWESFLGLDRDEGWPLYLSRLADALRGQSES